VKRTRAGAWGGYAITALVVTSVLAAIAGWLAGSQNVRAVWFAAALAYGLQLAAFALLLALRGQPQLFMAGWLGGMVLRFGVLGACAYWLSRTAMLPRGATLISFVGFVFVLLLLEPVFLRWDLRGS
jgi:hypothetical protein